VKAILGLILALALVQGAHAGPAPAALAEIKYLLDFVGKSGCQFYRNGVWYDSGEARSHLSYKYDVLADHGQIKTADDFIEKAATKSSLTGIAYKVRCADSQELSSNRWLRDALARYRLQGTPASKGAAGAPRPASAARPSS
jgi:hypothetical protein